MHRLKHPPQHAPGWGLEHWHHPSQGQGALQHWGLRQQLRPSRKHPKQQAWGRGAEPAPSTAAAACRGSLLRRGLPNTRPGSPRDAAPSERLAGCVARHGRRKSVGRQAAKNCALGHQAGLGGSPDLGRESIGPPCSDRAGGGAGSWSHRAPRAAGATAALPLLREHGDRLGHCRRLDTTPGTKSRRTDRSGHRRESWL